MGDISNADTKFGLISGVVNDHPRARTRVPHHARAPESLERPATPSPMSSIPIPQTFFLLFEAELRRSANGAPQVHGRQKPEVAHCKHGPSSLTTRTVLPGSVVHVWYWSVPNLNIAISSSSTRTLQEPYPRHLPYPVSSIDNTAWSYQLA